MAFAFFAVVLLAYCNLVSSHGSFYPRADNFTSPFANGGSWSDGFAQAKALVGQMVRGDHYPWPMLNVPLRQSKKR
jgi:hypothetical protein